MRRTFLAIVAILLLALATAVLFRTTLLAFALHHALTAFGFQSAQLRVVRLDLDGAEIVEIRLGDDLRADSLRLAYAPTELPGLKLRRVVLEAPVLDLSAEKGEAVEAIRGLLAGSGTGSAEPMPLPPVEVRNGTVRWRGPQGEVTVTIDGQLTPDGEGGLRAALDLTALGDAGRLQGRLQARREASGAISGQIQLARGDLTLGELELRGVSASGSFVFDGQRLTAVNGQLKLPEIRLTGEPVAEADWRVGLADDDRLTLRGEGRVLQAPFTLRLEGGLDVDDWRLRLSRLAAGLDLAGDQALSAALGLPAWEAGRARLRLVGGGASLPLAAMAASPSEVPSLLLASGFAASVTLDLEELAMVDRVAGLAATLGLDIAAEPDGLRLRPVLPAILEARQIAPALLESLGLPPEIAAQARGPWSLTLDPVPEEALVIRLPLAMPISGFEAGGALAFALGLGERASAMGTLRASWPGPASLVPERAVLEQFELHAGGITIGDHEVSRLALQGTLGWAEKRLGGRLDAMLRLGPLAHGDWRAEALSLSLPLELALNSEEVVLTAVGEGRLLVQRPRGGAAFRLPEQLAFRLGPGEGPAFRARFDSGAGFESAMALEPEIPIELEVLAEDQPLPVTLGPFSLRLDAEASADGLDRLRARFTDLRVALPAYHLEVDAIGGEVTLRDGGVRGQATFDVGRLAYTNLDFPIAPLAATGRLDLAPEGIDFEVQMADHGGVARLGLKGRYDLGRASLGAEILLPRVEFRPEGPQPRDLTALAADIREVAGAVSGEAEVAWAGGTLDGTARLVLDALSLEVADFAVEGISGQLDLASIWPPKTAKPQRLRIKRLESAVAIDDIEIAIAIESDAEAPYGRLRVDQASGKTDFGPIRIVDAVIDPLAGRHQLRLEVEKLDLAELLKLAAVEGLEATGEIVGALSISISDGRLALAPSTLRASGPGAIRFTSEAAREALASGGEQVALLLQALENFQYESLSLGLEKQADGSAKATLSILGKNPDVLDGHPFAVNIDLSGNFDSLFETAMDAYRLSDRAIRATVQ